jgi:hypothetical protein
VVSSAVPGVVLIGVVLSGVALPVPLAAGSSASDLPTTDL